MRANADLVRLEKSNAELNEICALAHGFKKFKCELFLDGSQYGYSHTGLASNLSAKEYTPTTNKEQAWDLMVKYSLFVDVHWSGAHYIHYGENDSFIDNETDLLRAVTIASILSTQEES